MQRFPSQKGQQAVRRLRRLRKNRKNRGDSCIVAIHPSANFVLSRDEDPGDKETAAEGGIADEWKSRTAGGETSAIYLASRNGARA